MMFRIKSTKAPKETAMCPNAYDSLMMKYAKVCKERDELKKEQSLDELLIDTLLDENESLKAQIREARAYLKHIGGVLV